MPIITEYGFTTWLVYTRGELDEMGLVVNPNVYIGSGFWFCIPCNMYTHMIAMSHKGQSDCFALCRVCNTCVRHVGSPINATTV